MPRTSEKTIGALRHRLTLMEPAHTPDGAGGVVESWTPFAECWGAVIAVTGRERDADDRRAGVLSHAITIRHRTDVLPSHRIAFGSRTFHITAIIEPDVRRQRLVCLVEEQDL